VRFSAIERDQQSFKTGRLRAYVPIVKQAVHTKLSYSQIISRFLEMYELSGRLWTVSTERNTTVGQSGYGRVN